MVTPLNKSDSFVRDNFFTGSEPVETTEITFATGQNLAAREAVAINTTTGKAVTFTEGGADGAGVLAEPRVACGDGAGIALCLETDESG